MNLEYYSSLALVTSAVVYMLALFAHAAEWAAAGRMGRRAEPLPEPVAVGAAVGPRPDEGRSSTSSDHIAAEGSTSERVELFGRIGVAFTLIGCMIALALLRLRQGLVLQSGWIAAIGGGLTLAGFTWAVSVGGEAVYERFFGIAETGVVQTFQENRGLFLEYTLTESLFE